MVISSPLQRCDQLRCLLIGLRPDLTFKTDPKLMEMNFGAWEGRLWADIPKSELDAWTEDFANYSAGTSGESVGQFMARVATAWDELPATENALWITHAGVIRATRLVALGTRQIADASHWPADAPAYGQWCTLDIPPANNSGGHRA
jgi:alpha-ribazole phosphatase